MKYIFIFVICCTSSLASASISLQTVADTIANKSLLHNHSILFRRSKPPGLIANCGGALQRRGQCFGKSVEDKTRNPARKPQPSTQSEGKTGQTNVIGPFQNRRTQRNHLTSSTSQHGNPNQRHQETSRTKAPIATPRLPESRSSTNHVGPLHTDHRSTRQNLLETGMTGISTIAPTELESVSSGSLKGLVLTQLNGRPSYPPTTKVKMRGPGFIEVDNFEGEPRTTRLQPGERGRDAMRDTHGAQSIAYTDPGGKSRSRGKGGLVTAKIHKHGAGIATVRIVEPTGTTQEVVDHRTYGTKTFTASSNDPANPATIKLKAAGSIYTSLMVQDKPRE